MRSAVRRLCLVALGNGSCVKVRSVFDSASDFTGYGKVLDRFPGGGSGKGAVA